MHVGIAHPRLVVGKRSRYSRHLHNPYFYVFVERPMLIYCFWMTNVIWLKLKLGSPNLDQGCKRLWLRSLLFCGTIERDLQGQIELQNQNLPHSELVHAITHHQLKLQFPNLEQQCIVALLRSLPILGLIEIDLQFFISNPEQIEFFVYIIGIL